MELLNKEAYEAAQEQANALREEAIYCIAGILWDFEAYEKRANELGIPKETTKVLRDFCINSLQETERQPLFVPGSVLLLPAFEMLSPGEQANVMKDLDVLFDQWSLEVLDEIPEAAFVQRDIACYVLGKDGDLLGRMPYWQNDKELVLVAVCSRYSAIKKADKSLMEDREVLRAAFENARHSILNDEFYSQFSDDDEFVRIAVKSYAANLTFASQRFRDDKEFVLFAIKNTDSLGVSNFYKHLSPHMQEDRDVVLAIAACPSDPHEFPPEQYRDDDEVGRLLADENLHEDTYTLFNMSPRIKEKWLSEEELERFDERWKWRSALYTRVG